MILDGKAVAKIKNFELKELIKNDFLSFHTKPRLDIILIGNDPASITYVNQKRKKSELVGINCVVHELEGTTDESEIISLINYLNIDPKVNGIILQLPVPISYHKDMLINLIDAKKDVDGLTLENEKLLEMDNKLAFIPATPLGILNLLDYYKIETKNVAISIIGASRLVGLPLSKLLTQRGANVYLCDKYTKDISLYTKKSLIVISATGVVDLITKDLINEGTILIDVGIVKTEDGIKGDISREAIDIASSYTPVPGGVGPMTVNALLLNTYKAYKNQKKESK
ncbi:MAG: bifunctional 5,10-methylenetetrahydrofolate dehydrogenase/5,10-methenyltetrahydrofolate cyclohydrolase [Acholeplasmatales bacterium]|jgi:methylenetetrahydrofolate dehydrogenase (NADP+)/methenyltetrahydrofolate cyclohydrolase|nr:bifunctional 5,10-methylenetetrahydrofolate dehydrogenase/5,10-methenyltetrahydrofolate cyclohydrolase [Acholeplasmatales bacterium]